MKFRYHPLARRELLKAARSYETEGPGLGDEFLNAIRDTIKTVTPAPYTWPVIRGRIRRRVLTSRFPFSIIYTVVEGKVFIVAVAHHKRRENYWASRVD
ncbi:MAG: type II toxin-antitoxin system RelE/ParE family toxin [Pyrinomonadaceae bacterium]|nr:type II toxin-antitoxin system RelE/ParE family toxin [Pyrinomonadaceae bacterium]